MHILKTTKNPCSKGSALLICSFIEFEVTLVKRSVGRVPRGYDGKKPTGRLIGTMTDSILNQISKKFDAKPQNIYNVFLTLMNDQVRPLVKPYNFHNGVLVVKVKNGTLLSILATQERGRLISEMRAKLPRAEIQNIVFQIG